MFIYFLLFWLGSLNQNYIIDLQLTNWPVHKLQICKSVLIEFASSKYRKVVSSNMSRLEAHAGFFRLLMKEIFDLYVLWPFDKKFIS